MSVVQVYMHLLNTVCQQLVAQQSGPPRTQPPLTVRSLDENLSSLFDEDLTTVPAHGFEQLFGAHRHDVDSEHFIAYLWVTHSGPPGIPGNLPSQEFPAGIPGGNY